MNHSLPTYFREFKDPIREIETGLYALEFNFFRIYLVDLRKIHLSGLDRRFLASFSTDEKFYELLGLPGNPRGSLPPLDQKEVDELEEYIQTRGQDPRIKEEIREAIMGAKLGLDVTEWVLPKLEQSKLEGKLEGKLETALRMWDRGMDAQTISEFTGLSIEQLKENGI